MPDPVEPPLGGGLAALFEQLAECPPPRACPPCKRDRYDIQVQWAVELQPNTLLLAEVRPGLVNAPGGGRCGMIRWAYGTEHELWTPWTGIEGCQHAPEPGFGLGLLVAVLVGIGRARRSLVKPAPDPHRAAP